MGRTRQTVAFDTGHKATGKQTASQWEFTNTEADTCVEDKHSTMSGIGRASATPDTQRSAVRESPRAGPAATAVTNNRGPAGFLLLFTRTVSCLLFALKKLYPLRTRGKKGLG
ncbi:hypothetical protein AAFF_G00305670 [Aldrovandia affinis]|uniref:Uncharacterized protein n=1 Tax=Aldrovandia affinis TaxID=143900 RepID=A0AAD7SPK7_9TELE|nr:hypothetical protein AAFF_G00305670 [Aldrovandia affinis]